MFMFGAAYFLHLVPGHLPNLCTMAWIPYLFFTFDQFRRRESPRWILAGMFGLSMQVFSGHIQYCYYTLVILTLYALFHPPQTPGKKKAFYAGLLLFYAGGGLLSAVQLLAGWDAVSESARSQSLSLDFLDIADITPERLWCLLMPDFFGGWAHYWGGGFYWEGAVFVSVTAFVLALYGLRASEDPEKKFFAGLALFLVLVGVGKRTPLFALFCEYFPLFNRFRGVGKLNIFITLCLIALASMGMDLVFRKRESLKGLAKGTFGGAAALLFAAALFFTAPRMGGERLFKQYLAHADAMAASLLGCAFLLGLLSLLSRAGFRKPALRWGFLLLGFLELFTFAWANLPFFDFDSFVHEMEPLQKVYQADPGDYRIFAGAYNYTLGIEGFDAWGDDPMVPQRYDSFATLTWSLRANYHQFHQPMENYPQALGLTRLRYAFYEKDGLLIPQKLDLPRTPRALLVGHWESAPREKIWPQLMDSRFDPRQTVWLESDPGIESGGASQGPVSVLDISSDKVEVRAELSHPALLLLTDNFSRGWKIEPIGTKAQSSYQVMPANGFQLAVPLGAGSHHFYLEYRPTAFVIGKWISILAWLAFAVFLFRERKMVFGKNLGTP
jgi:hypothetical protein